MVNKINIEEIEFPEEWLELQNYHFKLLAITTILADEKKAFRGTINDLCDFLEIGHSSGNKSKIKGCLEVLAESEQIKLIVDKDIYTVSLSKAIEKSKKVTKIKKVWYKLIKEQCKASSCSWESALKVFLVLYDLSQTEVWSYKEIGQRVGLGKSTVSSCVNTLKKITFDDFSFVSTEVKEKINEGEYRTKGQTYTKIMKFE